MNGLDINDTPFKAEVAAVVDKGIQTPCYHFDMDIHVAGQYFKPFSIMGVDDERDFLKDFYSVYAVTIQTTAYIKEVLIENMGKIDVTFKRYEIARNRPFSDDALRSPIVRRYKAKLYLEESEYIKQENLAANNQDYMQNKSMVMVKLQLVERGFEELKMRYVGGPYKDITGGELIRHLIGYHANLNNDDVNTLINGVDFAPNENSQKYTQVVIPQGTSLIEAMHFINQNTGGVYAAGFSYFIHANTWYVFPPYALNRFLENVNKLIVVNLPKDRLPNLERTFTINGKSVIVLSTRDSTVKDKRESKKIDVGTGMRFADAGKIMDNFATVTNNKLQIKASDNVNDVMLEERADGVNFMKFSSVKLSSAKNIELSKLAPTRGFLMQVSWENPNPDLIYPGMPVKILYLKRNVPTSVTGSVIGIKTVFYPFESTYPAMKFAAMSYIDVFVGDEQ